MEWGLATGLMPRGVMAGVTALVAALGVLLHYEGLTFLSSGLRRLPGRPRPRILVLILTLLVLHTIEIWVFALAYFACVEWGGLGRILALHPEVSVAALLDYVYFSAVVYTTVGFGEIVPQGPVRALVGAEAITGLTLITWSASYTYLEMQQWWRVGDRQL
jgi:hypothetical protein